MQKNILMEDNEKILNGIIETYLKSVKGTESQLYKSILEMILELDTKGGKFVKKSDIIKINSKIDSIFAEALKDSDYQVNVKDLLAEFDTIDKINTQFHTTTNDLNLSSLGKEFKQIKEVMVDQTQKALFNTGFNSVDIDLIKNTLRTNIFLGGSINETRDFLRQQIEGGGGAVGILERHATQVTRDAVYGYNGMIDTVIAEKFNMPWLMYVGSLKVDSRPQCRRWVDKRFLERAKLQEEIDWANNKKNGSGMRPGTTPENFRIMRGGYNCRHQAKPIFKPTEKSLAKVANRNQPK